MLITIATIRLAGEKQSLTSLALFHIHSWSKPYKKIKTNLWRYKVFVQENTKRRFNSLIIHTPICCLVYMVNLCCRAQLGAKLVHRAPRAAIAAGNETGRFHSRPVQSSRTQQPRIVLSRPYEFAQPFFRRAEGCYLAVSPQPSSEWFQASLLDMRGQG